MSDSEGLGYNWSERLVRQLVYDHHVPAEHLVVTAHGRNSGKIACEACHEPWPCLTLKELRYWVANGGYDDAPRACGDSHKCPRCGYMVGSPEREQK